MVSKLDSIQLYEIQKQIEYYLSDENLSKDHFFHEKISTEVNGYVDLDFFLKCNKVVKAKWTKDNLVEGIKLSDAIELDDSLSKVRRKDNPPLPELTMLNKKRRKDAKPKKDNKEGDDKEDQEEEKIDLGADPIILQLNTDKDVLTKWKDILAEFKAKNEGLNVVYGRFKGNEGHFGIIIPSEEELKFTDVFRIQDNEFKVKKCEGEELIDFWKNHGSHYELCTKEKKNPKKRNKKRDNKKFKESKK